MSAELPGFDAGQNLRNMQSVSGGAVGAHGGGLLDVLGRIFGANLQADVNAGQSLSRQGFAGQSILPGGVLFGMNKPGSEKKRWVDMGLKNLHATLPRVPGMIGGVEVSGPVSPGSFVAGLSRGGGDDGHGLG